MLGAGTAILYIYGEVTYRDAYGNDQFTRYRLMYGGESEIAEDMTLAICAKGNEAS